MKLYLFLTHVYLNFREPWLYLDHDRIGYDEIVKYYELGKLGILPRNQECTASGKFYNYCELRPMNEMSKNFIRAVNFISKSKCVSAAIPLVWLQFAILIKHLILCSMSSYSHQLFNFDFQLLFKNYRME